MSLANVLARWRAQPEIADQIVVWRSTPARQAALAEFPPDLHPALIRSLDTQGINALYTHQLQAWQAVNGHKNVVVTTGTASGKTLCYNLPVLDLLLHDPSARALYLFPTKALSQDQLNALKGLWAALPPHPAVGELPAAVYDGDTPSSARQAIRTGARLVLSNPDMLHTGILPHHTAWAAFFQNLRYVVIDELHIYRGVFGSHVANVLRRLQRVARFYGAAPQFILTSATIANPGEHAARMIAAPVEVINQDGSGRGGRFFLFYNPPVIDPSLGLRRSSMLEAVRLADDLLTYNIQTILFGRSRRTVELALTYLRQQSSVSSEAVSDLIRGYRSGYLPNQRREIEQGLRSGQVRAVVATNALELGVDIGGLGAAVILGYPGSIAAAWQQAGRAGRGMDQALSILVATADPLDQYLCRYPEYFFERSPEQALINPDNLLILIDHLRCAAFELPFQASENYGDVDSKRLAELLVFLEQENVLHRSQDRYFWMADTYPAQAVSLRSASADNVILQVNGDEGAVASIGQVDLARAAWMVHPGAVYLHEARSYKVDALDLEAKTAYLHEEASDYYTLPHSESTVTLIEPYAQGSVPGGIKYYGDIQVTRQLVGFRKVRWYTHETLGIENLDLPPNDLITTGYWIGLSPESVEQLREQGMWRNDPNAYGPDWPRLRARVRQRDGYRCQVCGKSESERSHDVHHKVPLRAFAQPGAGPAYLLANRMDNLVTLCQECHQRAETSVRVRSGLAGLAYVMGHLAPLFLMCDPGDLGVHSDPSSPLTDGSPCVVIYDQIPAGIGLSLRLYDLHDELMGRALELVQGCACSDGCPSCVGPGGENGLGGRSETTAILQVLVSPPPPPPSESESASQQ